MRFGCRGNSIQTGVILAQLGTPDAPTPAALRVYLKEFLSDPRVIDLNRAWWWLILNGIVLNTRPKRSAKLYKRIWTEKGSPLLLTTIKQAQKVKEHFALQGNDIEVEVGMRYGNPSLESAVQKLVDRNCRRIVVVPLYPQYAAPSTASVYDKLFPALLKYRYVPTLRVVEPFFDNPAYVKAVAQKIKDHELKTKIPADKILFSYHSIPVRYVASGDPYCCMCTATTNLIVKELNLPAERVMQTYQSRFGKEPWLTPFTDEAVMKLAADGIKNIAVVCPGFVADCLETLDEIGNELSHQFKEAGGESLELIPCVNGSDLFIECLSSLIEDAAGNWLKGSKGDKNILAGSCPAGVSRVANLC